MELHVGEMSAHVKMTADVLCCPSSRDCMASVPCALLNHKKVFFSFLSAFSKTDRSVYRRQTFGLFNLLPTQAKGYVGGRTTKKDPVLRF